ncbi:MAG TPA: hypothetical protein VLN59_09345 [Burkholderiales bacterium]|nr:hypothetical protein [Burkholderiales bacterium]
MNRKEGAASHAHAEHAPAKKSKAGQAAPATGMRLWLVTLRDPRKHRERKVWVTEVIALATTARGAEYVTRRELPRLFTYDPSVHVEALPHHVVKHLSYQADPRPGE